MPFVGSAHASHPSSPVANAHDADDALDARIDRADPNHSRATVARAANSKTIWIDMRLQTEIRQSGLHVGHSAVGRQAAPWSLARSPTLVIERQHHVAGVVQRPRVVGQIEVLNSGITMAEHDACSSLPRAKTVRQVDIPGELETLAVERDCALHIEHHVVTEFGTGSVWTQASRGGGDEERDSNLLVSTALSDDCGCWRNRRGIVDLPRGRQVRSRFGSHSQRQAFSLIAAVVLLDRLCEARVLLPMAGSLRSGRVFAGKWVRTVRDK